MGIYSFKPVIFDSIKFQKPDQKNEIQLTSAIKQLIDDGYKVVATQIQQQSETRLDIGTPESYATSFIK